MTDTQQLMELASELLQAKEKEQAATNDRIAIEERIAALVPTEDVGQKTIALPEGVKVTVKRGLNYKADCESILDICCKLELENIPIKVKTTRDLDEKIYNWYYKNDKDTFRVISEYVTVSPKKVSVTLKTK
jgi:hypothetical protein